MRLHQVLTGAANVFENNVAVATGTVEGRPFTAYGSGYDVAVLDGDFQRVQVLSDYTQSSDCIVRCVTCSDGNGKIAASFGSKVIIFEPEALSNKGNDLSKRLPYHWTKVHTISAASEVYTICLDKDGKRLLVGSSHISMWRCFSVLFDDGNGSMWEKVWNRRMATPVRHLEFSPDGHYFASAGIGDRMVKIWFQASKVGHHHRDGKKNSKQADKQKQQQQQKRAHSHSETYNFIYILHPKAVTGFSWRQKSKRMPLTCVLNVLLTSCADNVCRIWAETVKQRPTHAITATSTADQNKQRSQPDLAGDLEPPKELSPRDSSASLADMVDSSGDAKLSASVYRHHIISMYHFHLASVINPTADIALLSTIPTGSVFGKSFQLQWLNNKEIQFTTSYELLTNGYLTSDKQNEDEDSMNDEDYAVLNDMEYDGEMEANEDTIIEDKDDMTRFDEDDNDSGFETTPRMSQDSRSPSTASTISYSQSIGSISNSSNEKSLEDANQTKKKGIPITISAQVNQLLREWCTTGDTLFCIHPVDGSLLIWLIDYLDDFTSAFYRQPQVSFASRIPAAFTEADASSLNWTGTFYNKNLSKLISSGARINQSLQLGKIPTSGTSSQKTLAADLALTHMFSFLVSAHSDGTLNLWQLTFSDVTNFIGIASVTHLRRNCGPRFVTSLLATHPILPLVISTSQDRGNRDKHQRSTKSCAEECASELMLWRSDLVGPLSQLGGVTETARISSNDMSNFKHVAWFPHLFEHSLVCLPGPDGTDFLPCTPCACFVTSSNQGLYLHQVVLDSKALLTALTSKKATANNLNREKLSGLIESEQSGSKSTCVMPIGNVADSEGISDVKFLHVFADKTRPKNAKDISNEETVHENADFKEKRLHQSKWGPFYIVAVTVDPQGYHVIRAWAVNPVTEGNFSPVTPLSPESNSSQFSLSPLLTSKYQHGIFTTKCLETKQISVQKLPLPEDVKPLIFSAATDIPSSSCQNSTCPSSFWISVTTSDCFLRFYAMKKHDYYDDSTLKHTFEFVSSEYNLGSLCDKKFKVLATAHAHSLRLAWLSVSLDTKEPKVSVSILESESTGGDSWKIEDTVELPYKLPANVSSDSAYLDTLPIGLTWMSLENGAFILSAALGNSIYILRQLRTSIHPKIVSSTSSSVSVVRWSLLNVIDLNDKVINTITWTREGMLLVGVKNELRVYSQWEAVNLEKDTKADRVEEMDEGERNMLFSDNILYRAASATAVLPQYHPKNLIALMNMGKMRRVRAILSHLVRCVAGREAADEAAEAGDMIRTRSRTLSRTQSCLSSSPMDGNTDVAETIEDTPEINIIPPLPLQALIAADKDESGALQQNEEGTLSDEPAAPVETDYSSLFDSKPSSFGGLQMDTNMASHSKGTGMSKSAVYFGLAQAQLLAHVLTRRQLPGLNSINQLYLLALADTVATTNMDLESGDLQERGLNFARRETRTDEKLSHWVGGGGYATTGAIGATAGSGGDVVDDCGLKFLLAMRQHTTLLRSLPLGHRASLEDKGLPSAKIAWAFHSDCQEELLAMVPGMLRGEPSWKELKAHGVGWWVKSSDTLKRLIEKLAKAHFQINQDPLDCAVFYLASKKKTLLCALYRSLRDTKMSTFFGHDFKEDRWRKAALKNAYALLGMQRFEHAVAFFLLAEALWDAVQVCIARLKDLQLALVITRLYEGDMEQGSTFYRILSEYVLGEGTGGPDPDPFLRSMTYWLRRDYKKSLETLLLDPTAPHTDDTEIKYNEMASMGHPDIFNFYFFLRSHPYVRRCHLSQHSTHIGSRSGDLRKLEYRKAMSSENAARDASVFAPYERELLYRTAHTHLNSGMPSVALEVLMLLPKTLKVEENSEEESGALVNTKEDKEVSLTEGMIASGTISDGLGFSDTPQVTESVSPSKSEDFDWSKPVSSSKAEDFDWSKPVSNSKAEDFDWSKPVSSSKAEDFDWSKPVSNSKADDFDWNKPVSNSKGGDFDLSKPVSNSKGADFDWSKQVSTNRENSELNGLLLETSEFSPFQDTKNEKTPENDEPLEQEGEEDITSFHLKYITVFKCLIEELRSLPSTCTLDGVKLRPTVGHLLERELEVLHRLCDYRYESEDEAIADNEALHDPLPRKDSDLNQYADETGVEKRSLSQKAELLTRKIRWLRKNGNILTTLYNCCALQGVGGENLPAICLELLFLLHELEHYRSLAAPLRALSSGQTAPPLLLATMTTYSLFANPVTYLRNMTHDILRMLLRLPELPSMQNPINAAAALESLSLSLSSCIFHSLCGGHEDQLLESIRKGEVKIIGKENKEGKLVRQTSKTGLDVPGSHRKEHVTPTSFPSNWPGVQMFSSILAATNKEGAKNLKILLCEAAVAVYVALLVTSSSQFLPNQMYRIVMNQLNCDMWGVVFGGGTKLVLLDEDAATEQRPVTPEMSSPKPEEDKKKVDAARMKWNYRLLGKKAALPAASPSSGKFVQQELFIPPQMTLYDFFLKKPLQDFGSFEYNSQDSFESDDSDMYSDDDESELEEDTTDKKKGGEDLSQMSYSWRLMTMCVLKIVVNGIMNFLNAAGLEMSELPSLSPLLYSIVKLVLKWQIQIRNTFEPGNPPENFLPLYAPLDDGFTRGGPTLQKVKFLMDPNNTPFKCSKKIADPSKRLWHALVHQESLRETFLEFAFPKDILLDEISGQEQNSCVPQVIYKDADLLMGFCFNNANKNTLVVAAAHEVVELDVSNLTETESNPAKELSDRSRKMSPEEDAAINGKDRACAVSLRRPLPGVRRMESHPSLPYYMAGGNDGSVRMFEFGHPEQILSFRGPNVHERVNRIRFNSLGNKFGATDDSGYLCLWTLNSTANPKPYVAIKAYNRQAYDFAFLGSSSFIGTAGYSSEAKTVCIWDTLMSSRRSLVHSFILPNHTSQSVCYIPGQQCLLSGGRRGNICLFDIRQRKLLHTFAAHDSAIKCFAVDPSEEFFVSGSADGDIKVWGLTVHDLYDVYRKDHLRGTYLRHGSTGVQHLQILPSMHLLSCGSDGTLKLRQLEANDSIT